jgi:hypothetical protein
MRQERRTDIVIELGDDVIFFIVEVLVDEIVQERLQDQSVVDGIETNLTKQRGVRSSRAEKGEEGGYIGSLVPTRLATTSF